MDTDFAKSVMGTIFSDLVVNLRGKHRVTQLNWNSLLIESSEYSMTALADLRSGYFSVEVSRDRVPVAASSPTKNPLEFVVYLSSFVRKYFGVRPTIRLAFEYREANIRKLSRMLAAKIVGV